MKQKSLKNKPLVEAIFELRWALKEISSGIRRDPHYKLLVGRLYDRLNSEYPFHEQLAVATMPDEIAGYLVQHRFRKAQGKWPLIQIGPGIITVNDTEGYTWRDFSKRIASAINILFEVYPEPVNLKFDRLLLRYINAITFDFEKDSILSFLKEKMKTDIALSPRLFENVGVSQLPLGVDLRFSFGSEKPKGTVHLRFARGKKNGFDVLFWETMVDSHSEDIREIRDRIDDWLKDAHNLAESWFFKLVEGELLRRFE